MKTWLTLTTAAALLAACAQTETVAAAPPPMDEGTVIAASLGYHVPAAPQPVRPAN